MPTLKWNLKAVVVLGLAVVLSACAVHESTPPKQWVGATERVSLLPSGLKLLARVDTGAKTTSIHAINIRTPIGLSIGKPVSFTTSNANGKSISVDTRIAGTALVKTSEGSERRIKIPLNIKWQDQQKQVLVTLNDRSSMQYRLLLGRNWLTGDYVVDVDKGVEEFEEIKP